MKKFNGVFETWFRWYDSETGDIVRTKNTGEYKTEIEFSRQRLKTKKLDVVPVIPETIEDNAFYINGIPSSGGAHCYQDGRKADFIYQQASYRFPVLQHEPTIQKLLWVGQGR